jgi:hypothetical protein
LYDEKKRLALKSAQEAVSFSVTFDGWTCRDNASYLGLTMHWIDNGFHLRSLVLGLEELKERHTGEYLSEVLCRWTAQYGIGVRDIVASVTDSGANMLKAARDLGLRIRLRCFAHQVHNAVKHALQGAGVTA